MATQAPAPRAARNLDAAREEAILDATFALLTEVGYDRMSVDEIARRAKASKATIYRRWTGKAEIVAAVIHRLAVDHPPLPDTGTLRGDLIAGLATLCRVIERKYPLVVGLTQAIRADAELGRLLHHHVVEPGFAEATEIFERARARGEIAGRLDPRTILAVSEALIWHRLLLTDDPLDDGFVAGAVDEIVLPLISGTLHP
jgi:AcrR family transcriptional regulator